MASSRDKERLTASQVADLIGYNTSTINHWYHAGKMPPLAPPKQREWYRGDIKKWIAENFDTE